MCFLALLLLACISPSSNRPMPDSNEIVTSACTRSKENLKSTVGRLSNVFHDFCLPVFTSLCTTLPPNRADLYNKWRTGSTMHKTLWLEFGLFSWSSCCNVIPLWKTEAGKCGEQLNNLRFYLVSVMHISHSSNNAPSNPAPEMAGTCLSLNKAFKKLGRPPVSGDGYIPLWTMGYLSPLHKYHQIKTVSIQMYHHYYTPVLSMEGHSGLN